MSKRTNAKHKICRRQVASVCGKPNCPVHVRNYTPGQHGPAGLKGVLSDYGKQLRAKQMLKLSYGGNITEKQFRKIYNEARRRKGDTSENLIGLLESRIDAMLFRAHFVPSMQSARQFVSHKHVKVNGHTVNIPSYQLKVGDVLELRDSSKQLSPVLQAQQNKQADAPDYLEVDDKKMAVKLTRLPKVDDVPYPVVMEPSLVVEFYSR